MSHILWWGYQHTSGTLQVKRYFNQQDVEDAYASPFVDQVVGPFEAASRDDALKILKGCLE